MARQQPGLPVEGLLGIQLDTLDALDICVIQGQEVSLAKMQSKRASNQSQVPNRTPEQSRLARAGVQRAGAQLRRIKERIPATRRPDGRVVDFIIEGWRDSGITGACRP